MGLPFFHLGVRGEGCVVRGRYVGGEMCELCVMCVCVCIIYNVQCSKVWLSEQYVFIDSRSLALGADKSA